MRRTFPITFILFAKSRYSGVYFIQNILELSTIQVISVIFPLHTLDPRQDWERAFIRGHSSSKQEKLHVSCCTFQQQASGLSALMHYARAASVVRVFVGSAYTCAAVVPVAPGFLAGKTLSSLVWGHWSFAERSHSFQNKQTNKQSQI